MQCPTREELRALLEDQVEASSKAVLESHVAECDSCGEVWARLARESTLSNSLSPQPAPRATAPGTTLPTRSTSQTEFAAGTRVGRYFVVSMIGVGGMGSVYRAYDPELNRNVAIKVIRTIHAGEKRQKRLLREAQALAHVAHPNVVNVFDVGEFLGQLFFAMELVEGTTLRAELREATSDRRHLMRLLDQAGRGLAAAHRAGLIHRDFKPENVLIDRSYHVKVADFGLALAVADATSSDDTSISDSPTSVLDLRVTDAGTRVGTPEYMAPEQYEKGAVDARSDQFSFAIVAYEALFGRHPFHDKRGRLSVEALCAGKIEVSDRRLPPGYLRVLSRGLARDPANRYPSLQHLLDELNQVPRRRLRRGVAIATVACAAIGLIGAPVIQRHRAQRCDTAASQALAGIWDAPRREKVESIFVGDGKAFGRDVWNRIATALDAYSGEWKRTNVDLCKNAEWWRVEDNALHKRTSMCLDERRRELRAVTDVLAEGDRDVRLRAPDILIQLDSLATCTNPATLALTPLPVSDKATLTAVERIRDLLAQARALNDAGKLAPAEEAARQAVELAGNHHDRALSAEALYRLSVVQEAEDKYDASEASLVQALADAESSSHERLRPLILTQMLSVVGYDQGHADEVERLIPFIQSSVERFDRQGPANIQFLLTLGGLESKRGQYDRAIERFSAALDMTRHAFGENDIRRIEIYQHLASTERAINQLDKGIAHARSALAETEALFGNDHPQLMRTLGLLARMLSEQGDGAGTQAMAEHALRIIDQVSSPGGPDVNVTNALFELAMAYLEDGQPEIALSLFRRSMTNVPATHTNVPVRLANMARAEEALGHLETARTTYEEAIARFKKMRGPGHPQTILPGVRLGRLLRTMHRERESLQLCTQLLEDGERALGPRGVYIALILTCVGEGYEQLGRLPEALRTLERADKLFQEEAAPHLDYRAPVRFALARVLWQTGGDGARARRLATEAADDYQHAGRSNAQNVVAVQAWLTKTSAQP